MSAEKRARVVKTAMQWMGTPYHHHGRVHGAGVDCANLLVAVFHEAGVVPNLDLGHYPHDWHLHRSEELFLAWVKRVGAVPVSSPTTGDVAVFRFGRTFSHGAVMLDEHTAIHSYIDRGVILSRLDEEPLAGRDVQFWSLWHERSANDQHERDTD